MVRSREELEVKNQLLKSNVLSLEIDSKTKSQENEYIWKGLNQMRSDRNKS